MDTAKASLRSSVASTARKSLRSLSSLKRFMGLRCTRSTKGAHESS